MSTFTPPRAERCQTRIGHASSLAESVHFYVFTRDSLLVSLKMPVACNKIMKQGYDRDAADLSPRPVCVVKEDREVSLVRSQSTITNGGERRPPTAFYRGEDHFSRPSLASPPRPVDGWAHPCSLTTSVCNQSIGRSTAHSGHSALFLSPVEQ